MYAIGYITKPDFLAVLVKELLTHFWLTKVLKQKDVFLVEEVLCTYCSVFVCGRVKSGWTYFGQFFEIKPSKIFAQLSKLHKNLLHSKQHMIKKTKSDVIYFWMSDVSLPELSVSIEHAFILCPMKSCWKTLAQKSHEYYPLHTTSCIFLAAHCCSLGASLLPVQLPLCPLVTLCPLTVRSSWAIHKTLFGLWVQYLLWLRPVKLIRMEPLYKSILLLDTTEAS